MLYDGRAQILFTSLQNDNEKIMYCINLRFNSFEVLTGGGGEGELSLRPFQQDGEEEKKSQLLKGSSK